MTQAHLSKIQALLAQSPLFREAAPAEIERIARTCRDIRAPKGTVLFQKGDPSDGFYLVVFGQVKLSFLSSSGNEKIVEIIGPGQTFGEAVMFLERPYPVYAQTLEDSLLLHVSKSSVFQEIEADRAFALKLLAGLSIRLHGLIHDVAAYSLDTSVQRLVGFLLSQDGAEDSVPGQPMTVTLPAGKAVIASRLNIAPETFSRILQDLSARGLIDVRGREITVRDPDRLRSYRH